MSVHPHGDTASPKGSLGFNLGSSGMWGLCAQRPAAACEEDPTEKQGEEGAQGRGRNPRAEKESRIQGDPTPMGRVTQDSPQAGGGEGK